MKTIDHILKIKAVVLYILKAFPEGVDYIHLFKVMYFAQQNGSPDKPGGLSIQLCKSEKKEFYIRYSS